MSSSDEDDGDGSNGSASPPSSPVEALVTGRAKRSTAGNLLRGLLENLEEDEELRKELLEDEPDDAGEYTASDRSDDDAALESSSDDSEHEAAAGEEDDADEKKIRREERVEQRKKRKDGKSIVPAFSRKRVKLDVPGDSNATEPNSAALMPPPPRPKKKSERLSWLPTTADAPTRQSSRSLAVANREVITASLTTSRARSEKQKQLMARAAARKEADKRPELTREERMAKAARIERENARSLNRWEMAEREREREREEKLKALRERTIEGPYIGFWSGSAVWQGTNLVVKRLGTAASRKKDEDAKEDEAAGAKVKGDEAEGAETKGDEAKDNEAKGAEAKGDEAKGDEVKSDEAKGDKVKDDKAVGDNPEGDADGGVGDDAKDGDVKLGEIAVEGAVQPEALAGAVPQEGAITEAVPQAEVTISTTQATAGTTTPTATTSQESAMDQATLSEQDVQAATIQEAGQVPIPQQDTQAAQPSGQGQNLPQPSEMITGPASWLNGIHEYAAQPAALNGTVRLDGVAGNVSSGLSQQGHFQYGLTGGVPQTVAPSIMQQQALNAGYGWPPLQPQQNSQPPQPLLQPPQPPPPPPPRELAQRTLVLLANFPSLDTAPKYGIMKSRAISSIVLPHLSNLHSNPPLTPAQQTYLNAKARTLTSKRHSILPDPPPAMLCAITSHKARYRDPKTGLGYEGVAAYKGLQRLLAGCCTWSGVLGAWVGPTYGSVGRPARGVPPGFAGEVVPAPAPTPTVAGTVGDGTNAQEGQTSAQSSNVVDADVKMEDAVV